MTAAIIIISVLFVIVSGGLEDARHRRERDEYRARRKINKAIEQLRAEDPVFAAAYPTRKA